MRRLETALQRYAWGKSGSESMVAQLKQSEDSDFDVDEGQTYAELWMGTHPNGPSRVMRDGHEGTDELQGLYGSAEGPGMFLIELLETYPHFLGDQEHVGDLPFMFKVLSINKALSIQAHPDKKLAERLYATRPDLYKDDNHKPEMAVALSDFEGLCGFRPFREIVYSLEIYPELRAMVGAEATAQAFACTSGVREHEENALRVLFRAFVTANTDVVTAQVSNLVERLKSEFCHGPAGKLRNETNRSNGNDGTYVVDVDCDGHGHSRGGSGGGGGCSTSSTSSIDNDDDGLSAWRGKSPSFANRVSSSVPARHRNFGAICEDGEDSDMVAAEIQQEEGLRGAGGKLDGDRSGLEKAEMDIVHVRGDGDSEDLKNEEMQMLNVADGASDGTAETADGVTDNEDINTEEDDSSQSHRHPRPDGHDRASDLSSSNNSSTSNISTIHISNSNNSSISISSDCSSDNSSSSGHASGNHGVHGVATISSTEKGQLASSMRHNAAAAAAVGGGIPSCAFRRRGWSSSILAFSDVTGQRRAKEDLALRELILRLAEEYPGDIGIMMPLLLNYLRMGEGESFFMAANEPHAYLKGDILEVMARSDNVVRVALTPKHRDVPLLCQILTYNMGAPPIVTPIQVDQFCSRYTPPIKDFEMLDIQVPHGQEYATPPAPVAALAIVMAGTGFARAGNGRQKLCRGRAFFVPAGTTVVYTNSSVAGEAAALWVCLARSNINYAEGCEES